MNGRLITIGYIVVLLLLTVLSWGFVDANLPLKTFQFLYDLVHFQRQWAVSIYSLLIIALFVFYGFILWFVEHKLFNLRQIITLIGITIGVLFFAFPGLSYDIFNYIATAKVTFFYKENPYLVMPIEIPNEPMLAFLHAANKTALYGPVWILLTGIPFILGLGDLFVTIFAFKAWILVFYVALVWLIWKISNHSLRALTLFALNPLVVIETLIGAHNDAVMMFLALASFYFFKHNRITLSLILLLLSAFIKFATLFLFPIYAYLLYLRWNNAKTDWQQVWRWSALAMYLIFFLSPLREEVYSWYLIWPLTFVVLIKGESLLLWLSLGFSAGLLFRISPFIYTRSWGGITPLIKKIVTFVPAAATGLYYAIKKKI